MPERKEDMEREGYADQALADLLDERLTSRGERARRGSRPSDHPIGLAVTLAVGATLGYLREFDTGHNARTRVPGGWLGSLLALAILTAVFAVMEVAARRRD